MDNLIGRRWRRVDTSADRWHQQELNSFFALKRQRQHVARQANHRSHNVLVHGRRGGFASVHDFKSRSEHGVDIDTLFGKFATQCLSFGSVILICARLKP
ncbi:hypothetical protein ROG8370_03935 [Roseovarius gaetbuli]|uniref:Uncharacterized protein n=1 Tax=Roseovarius gaetbuli TaxID=1356575 RepID=A0A1X7ADY1_9RHOB|nr:hypothetical protein ROG8370_03935 [Roseovarius gaetbuli]